MAILTISHQMGAGGPEIGMALGQRLGYHYVDQELIQDAVRRYGLAEDKASHLDESKPTLFERFDAETRHYITVLQTTLLEFAERDNVILMGRGGQWLLRGVPHALRVRVTAPFDVRVARLAKQLPTKTGESSHRRALTEMVRHDDAGKSGRMRYLYDVDIRDPALYDVLLNTRHLTTEAAVDLLTGLLRSPALAATDAGRRMVADRALASRVEVALASHAETRKHRITVEARDGVVTLGGTGALDEAVTAAREVPGVSRVSTRPVEIPPMPPFVV
jgi:cytidylate kinase